MSLYRWIDGLGEQIEKRMPGILRDNVMGDPASWLQHTLVCLAVMAPLALLAHYALGDWQSGAYAGIVVGVMLYAYREVEDARAHMKRGDPAFKWELETATRLRVGWGADLIGDFAGPFALWLWLL